MPAYLEPTSIDTSVPKTNAELAKAYTNAIWAVRKCNTDKAVVRGYLKEK